MRRHQLPIATGVMLVSAATGAAVSGYPRLELLLIGAGAGLLSILLGLVLAPKPSAKE
ncbi:hypothetical protein ACFQH2_06945 [Natronoarchaeum sp. GCM10025703]|uniref:hypothetical protein n=1 Tax=unclassified Natronoarchaeum TaxID=2620183 RepID=UPI003615284B